MDDKYRVLLPLVCALSLLSFPTPWAEATATAGASRRLTQSLSPSPTEVKGTPVQPSVSTTAVTSPPVVTSAPAGTTEATAQHKETVTWATFFNTNAPGSDLIGSPTTTAYVTPSDQCSGTGALVATAAACAQACATWQLAVPPPLNPGACAAFVYVWTYPQGLNPIPVPGCCFLKSGTVSGIDNYGTNLSGEEFLSGLYR